MFQLDFWRSLTGKQEAGGDFHRQEEWYDLFAIKWYTFLFYVVNRETITIIQQKALSNYQTTVSIQ